MTKLVPYKCDRCKDDFNVEDGKQPERITYTDEQGNPEPYDLCPRCSISVSYAIGQLASEVDKLVDEISEKDEDECAEA